MNRRSSTGPSTQKGVVLIASMLLLIVMTIIAISMFRSIGLQGKIAGNVMEKQRALNAAESAQLFAENWLSSSDLSAISDTLACSGVQAATMSNVQICENVLSQKADQPLSVVPWTIGGTPVGFTYDPTGLSMSGSSNYYAGLPMFYISDVGTGVYPCTEIYQIDAFGYAGTTATVAAVESTYLVESVVFTCIGS